MNKKKNTLLIVSLAIVILAIILIGIIIFVRSNSPERRLQEQLELGSRYLEELDYDRAIAAFEVAIEIDPRNAESYVGLVNAYAGLNNAEALVDVYSRAGENISENDINSLKESVTEIYIEWIDSALSDGDVPLAEQYILLLSRINPEKASEYNNSVDLAVDKDDAPENANEINDDGAHIEKSVRSDGVVFTYVYDEYGNMIRKDGTDGTWEIWQYDENNNLIRDERDYGWFTEYEYDQWGNKVYEATRDSWIKWTYDGTTLIDYDFSYGDLIRYEDDGYNVVYYEYTITGDDLHWNKMEYDSYNNQIYTEGSDGFWFRYEYDGNTRRSTSTNMEEDFIIRYDSRGNIISCTSGAFAGTYMNYYSDGVVLSSDNPDA